MTKFKDMNSITKKIMMALCMLLGMTLTMQAQDTDRSLYDNIMYIEPATGYIGTQLKLSLQMKNSKAVAGYQCDIQLPKDWKVATNARGRLLVRLSTDRATAETITNTSGKMQNDSILRILAYTTEGDANGMYTFDGDSGEVATITIDLPANITAGSYPIKVSEIEMTAPTNEIVALIHDTISTTMTIKDGSTGIHGAQADHEAGKVYSTSGIRVRKNGMRHLKKGIYIQNGRKIVMK